MDRHDRNRLRNNLTSSFLLSIAACLANVTFSALPPSPSFASPTTSETSPPTSGFLGLLFFLWPPWVLVSFPDAIQRSTDEAQRSSPPERKEKKHKIQKRNK